MKLNSGGNYQQSNVSGKLDAGREIGQDDWSAKPNTRWKQLYSIWPGWALIKSTKSNCPFKLRAFCLIYSRRSILGHSGSNLNYLINHSVMALMRKKRPACMMGKGANGRTWRDGIDCAADAAKLETCLKFTRGKKRKLPNKTILSKCGHFSIEAEFG